MQSKELYESRMIGFGIVSVFHIVFGIIIFFITFITSISYISLCSFLFSYAMISALIWLGLSLFNYIQLRKYYKGE